jgi:hypothetical protein
VPVTPRNNSKNVEKSRERSLFFYGESGIKNYNTGEPILARFAAIVMLAEKISFIDVPWWDEHSAQSQIFSMGRAFSAVPGTYMNSTKLDKNREVTGTLDQETSLNPITAIIIRVR